MDCLILLLTWRYTLHHGLVVEESNMCKGHGDTIFVACVDNMVVTDATACMCYVFYTALMSTLDVVAKGEEGITTY